MFSIDVYLSIFVCELNCMCMYVRKLLYLFMFYSSTRLLHVFRINFRIYGTLVQVCICLSTWSMDDHETSLQTQTCTVARTHRRIFTTYPCTCAYQKKRLSEPERVLKFEEREFIPIKYFIER